jgi:hypothetical protein
VIVAILLVILIIAIPLGIGFVMTSCRDCPCALDMACGFAFLATVSILCVSAAGAMVNVAQSSRLLLLVRTIERPPRFA